jgi:hypothetical protein
MSNLVATGSESVMQNNRSDLTVFARDYPETRLVLELKSSVTNPIDQRSAIEQVSRYMWGANCHYGLVMTPAQTYVLRDDFTTPGPESIRVTDVLPTARLLSRVREPSTEPISEQQLEMLAREWLQRLTASYETALPLWKAKSLRRSGVDQLFFASHDKGDLQPTPHRPKMARYYTDAGLKFFSNYILPGIAGSSI